jgi:hypothetical protein
MRKRQPHKVIEIGVFWYDHQQLTASVISAGNRCRGCCLYRGVFRFIKPWNLLTIKSVELVRLNDLSDNIAWIVDDVTCPRQGAKISFRIANRRNGVFTKAKVHELSDILQVVNVFE